MKEQCTTITTWVKCVPLFIIVCLMLVLLSSCEDNNVPTHTKKNEASADKVGTKNKSQKDSSDKSDQDDVEIYAGSGTDFYSEEKTGLADIANSYVNAEYMNSITALLSKYGSLRIVQNNGEWQNEANGLCYLNLIDFTRDGEDELMAVCKNEDEEHYTGYIYTIKDGSVELLYENSEIEYNFFQGFDVLNLGYTSDTGYVFGTGWEDADADDMTFFWYKDGKFEQVYRFYGYWDGELEDEVILEESIIVDIFDDDHRDEYYNNSQSVTLRTMSDINVDGDDFSLNDLQRNIDIVIQKLGGDSNTPNVDMTNIPSTNDVSQIDG